MGESLRVELHLLVRVFLNDTRPQKLGIPAAHVPSKSSIFGLGFRPCANVDSYSFHLSASQKLDLRVRLANFGSVHVGRVFQRCTCEAPVRGGVQARACDDSQSMLPSGSASSSFRFGLLSKSVQVGSVFKNTLARL